MFNGISAPVGYLMPNLIYIYSFSSEYFVGNFISKQAVRVHLFARLNGFKYSYQTVIILFNINYLFTHNKIVSTIANTNNSIKY